MNILKEPNNAAFLTYSASFFFFLNSQKQLSQLTLLLLSHLKMTFLCVIGYSFPGGVVVKNRPADAGEARNAGLSPGLGGSPGGGNGNPLQYSCLENASDNNP